LVQKQKTKYHQYTLNKQLVTSTKNKFKKLQNFKCNYSLASTLKKKICIYNIENKKQKKNFCFWIFLNFQIFWKVKKWKKKNTFLPYLLLLPHGVKKKKLKKNFHHHQKIYIPSNFFSYFKQQNKIKMNLVAPKNEILLLTVGKTLL